METSQRKSVFASVSYSKGFSSSIDGAAIICAEKAEFPLSDNPFTYGNPISEPKRFVGRKREVEQIFSRLRNIEFESSSLVGERRLGKTSLLDYVMHPDIRQLYGLASNDYLFVYVDLQLLDVQTTPVRLWQRIFRQMGRICHDSEIKLLLEDMRQTDSIDNFALADLFDTIDEKNLHVVFLLDEFENVTENQHFDPAFFYGLRSLAIHHNLSLITSSRRELIELCHSEAIRSSPFFNIFANIIVRLFTETEAQQLISQLLTGTNVSFTDSEISTVFRIAGYHPYFLQAACYFLYEAYASQLNPDERVTFLLKEYRKEATPHFDDYWRNSYEQEKIVLTVLALLKQQRKVGGRAFHPEQLQELYTQSAQTLQHLERRGLLTQAGETYSLFNVSFGDWICSELTDTMHDQQSYEDWLKSNRGAMERLSTAVKKDVGDILPRISDKYRELIITWVSDPRNLLLFAGLLKSVLGLG